MTDFITIKEFKAIPAEKTHFPYCLKVKVTQISEQIPGDTNGKQWTRQPITIADSTGEIKLSLFNGNICKVDVGKTYEFCNMTVEVFQNNNYPNITSKTTIKEVAGTSDDYLESKKEQIKEEQTVHKEQIKHLASTVFKSHEIESLAITLDKLLVIEEMVTTKLTVKDQPLNVQRAGLFIKLLAGISTGKISLD